jgi:hypothetical protein
MAETKTCTSCKGKRIVGTAKPVPAEAAAHEGNEKPSFGVGTCPECLGEGQLWKIYYNYSDFMWVSHYSFNEFRKKNPTFYREKP